MSRTVLLRRALIAVFLLAGTTGCHKVINAINGTTGNDEVDQRVAVAYESKDLVTLDDICSNQGRKTFGKSLGYSANRRAATPRWCKTRDRLRAELRTADNLAVAKAGCAQLPEAYANRFDFHLGSDESVAAVGVRLAECKQWPMLFENFSNSEPGRMMEPVRAAIGGAFETQLIAHLGHEMLQAKRRDIRYSRVERWFETHGTAAHCPGLLEAAEVGKGYSWEAGRFFIAKGCTKEATQIAERQIMFDHGPTRSRGCDTLGKVGTPRHIERLTILAQSDAYQRDVKVTRGGTTAIKVTYPVREACRAAAGKIKLRAS